MSGWTDDNFGHHDWNDVSQAPEVDPQAAASAYSAMQAKGLNIRDASKASGIDQTTLANYLNQGRKLEGANSDEFQGSTGKWNYDEVKPIGMSRQDFDAEIAKHKDAIGADGRFKGPESGVHYSVEGRTPEELWNTYQGSLGPRMDIDGSSKTTSGQLIGAPAFGAARNPDGIDIGWEAGPDNGGGGIAGVGRAIGNTGTGAAHNPAIVAALTAGIGSMLAPAAASGATAGGLEMGGSAGIGSGTVLGGGAASVNPGIISSIMNSPYSSLAKAGVKTALSGGKPADFVKSLAGSYLGNEVSGLASDAGIPGSGIIGSVAASTVTGGDPLKALVNGGVSTAANMITSGIDGFDALPDFQKTIIRNTLADSLKGKPPTQALVNQARGVVMAQMRGGTTTPSHGGWSE